MLVPMISDTIGISRTKLVSAATNSVGLIASSFTKSIWVYIFTYHLIYFSVACTDVLVRVTIKESFSAKTMPIYMSVIKTAAGLGATFQSVLYGVLLK
jgi:MFS family permease